MAPWASGLLSWAYWIDTFQLTEFSVSIMYLLSARRHTGIALQGSSLEPSLFHRQSLTLTGHYRLFLHLYTTANVSE